MKDFEEFNLENMGGNESFNFVPQYYLSAMPQAIDNVISEAITLRSGYSFNKGICVQKTLNFEETNEETNAGTLYKYKINGIYPGQSMAMHTLLDSMARSRHIVDITDNNGKRRLIGSDVSAATFAFTYKSKETPSGRPEYSFLFYWESTDPAPFYNI